MRAYIFGLLLAATLPGAALAGTPGNPCASAATRGASACIGRNCNASITGQSVTIGDNVRITQTGRIDGVQVTIGTPGPAPTPSTQP